MRRIVLILVILSLISKCLGFFREIVLAYFYGASAVSDAYLISITIPTVIFAFVGTALATSYIPLYTSIEKEKGEKEALRFSNNLINFLLLFCFLIAGAGFVFAQPIVKVFASGFTGETLRLAVFFTRVSIVAVFFMGLTYIFRSYLQIKNDFISPALIGFPYNIIVISSIILSVKINVAFLPLGLVLAIASQFLFILPFALKKGYRYQFIMDKSDPQVRKLIYLALPVILGTSVSQINTLVDRTLASGIAVGGISALNYANRINGVIQDIFVASLSTVMYPMIARMATAGNIEGLKKTLGEVVNAVTIVVVPIMVGTALFSAPVVHLLLGRGAFDIRAAELTSWALFFYAAGMLGTALMDISARAFYAMRDTETPMRKGIVAVLANIILNIILSRFLGIGGLALATSISALLGALLLFISLRRKIGPLGIMNMATTFVKVVLASAVMGMAAKGAYNFILPQAGSSFALLAAVLAGGLIYSVVIYFMRIREVQVLAGAVKERLGSYF